MAKLYPFEVHTPYRLFYSDMISSLTLTLPDGEIGIYADHAPFTAQVCIGILKIKDKEGNWVQAFITEGFLEVKPRKTVLLVDAAEWPHEIDHQRALEAKKRAEEQISGGIPKFKVHSVQSTLNRAEFRLRVYNLGRPS